MKNILVTGGAGFIGSNFVRYLLSLSDCDECKVINLDNLTYAGNKGSLADMLDNERHIFIKGDIRDRELLAALFERYCIDTVVNFAAETHVDRSIEEPTAFFKTNVMGTQSLLEAAKNFWKIEPENKYSICYKPGVRFVQISTDEVYGALGAKGKFTEESPLAPNSPYSASKAGADLAVRAYFETFGLPVNITRCSNNYGQYQHFEKLIPLLITNCIANKSLPVYGDGQQVRDWLHVLDHCSAIVSVLKNGKPGEIYNIGGGAERENIDVVKMILAHLGKPESLIRYVADRPGHDRRYAIDFTKIERELGWRPVRNFEEGLAETVKWHLGRA